MIGGPHGDCGLTGRKIIVDTYGGYGRHGGGAFSGKDPSKVDRSACYMARYVAKNVVAAGLAAKCEIQVAYAIGVAEPVSILIDTFDTGTVPDQKLSSALRELFDFRPAGIIKTLDLKRPIYKPTAAYGHFGRVPHNGLFPWEQTDMVDALRSAFGATAAANPQKILITSADDRVRGQQPGARGALVHARPLKFGEDSDGGESQQAQAHVRRVTHRTRPAHDVRDLDLAEAGRRRSTGPTSRCRCCGSSASASPRRSRCSGQHLAPACMSPPRPPICCARSRRAAPRCLCCASNPLSTQDDVAAALVKEYGIPTFAMHGEDRDTYYSHLRAVLEAHPTITMDDGADLVSLLHTDFARSGRRGARQHGGDHHRRHPAARDGAGRRTAHPGGRGQRRPDQVPVRQPLRHRPVDDRRDHPRDRRAGGGLDVFVVAGYGWCGRGVASRARGLGGQRDRDRGQPDPRAGGRAGRLPGDADGGGGAHRRHLRHRHRRQGDHRREPHERDEGRRDRLQLGPLRRRDRSAPRCASWRAASIARPSAKSRPSICATGASSTCSARDGW